ncbi:MAG: hypothetical protein F6K24_32255 [Okeania sp. SIO2D1]|uniref:hypothetical protein n=1 Tax=Okeania sp. SIO2C9 TaxID=2607791 RepID=UPI0013BD9CB0|nr:hypothetical protein [Okeania sp. SIO2C9]NEQ77348.1 hypothetical protein [Okeania sp. SIO2C9]NES69566.1 hypothetical protein [Okeania sp. SIO2D1]
MILIAHYLGVSSQESGEKKEEETPSRRRKFFGERKGHGVLSHSYPDMISYLKLPTPKNIVDQAKSNNNNQLAIASFGYN